MSSSSADCCCAMWQSPIQAILRPAEWVPGIRNLHRDQQTWVIPDAVPETCLNSVISTINNLGEREKIHVHEVDYSRYFVQIFSFTAAEWLDIVEIKFQPGQENGTLGKATSFSTGLFPLMIPFAFLLNIIFFFVPFYDQNLNKKRLDRIREAMKLDVHLMESKPPA